MKRNLITIVIASLFFFINTAEAQTVYVLQNGSKVQFLTSIDDAMTNLEDGDTLYLPGGKPIHGSIYLNKRVHIIGAGYHPDSAKAAGVTQMLNNIEFNKGSKGSSITGVLIVGKVCLKDSALTVSRCNMEDIDIQSSPEPISQIYINDCIIRGALNGVNSNVTNCLIERCIIKGNIGSGDKAHNLMIKNCILSYSGNYAYSGLHNLSIVNSIILNNKNIFCSYSYGHNCTGITLSNNLWVRSNLSGTGYILKDNVWGIPIDDIFVDFENEDYRIKSTCEEALTLADDGGQVGIYGTDEPFLVPTFAPRFTSIDNAKYVKEGKLSIKMQVEARDR